MKNAVLLIFGWCLFMGNWAFAQVADKKPEPVVPEVVKKALKTKYPAATVTDWDWKADKNAYKADLRMDGKEMDASFSPEGKWLKTKTKISAKQLPPAVTKAVTGGEYKSWILSDFAEIETPDKGKMYKVEVKSGAEQYDLKYDANGNLLEKQKDKPKKSAK
jgi:uncharacterized membrane protein YkoI